MVRLAFGVTAVALTLPSIRPGVESDGVAPRFDGLIIETLQ
jgi:hypothetical protein